MSEHSEAVEADLLSHYGVDVRTANLGVRRLRALVLGLPPGSAIHRALDPEWWSWTGRDELLSAILRLVDHSNRLFIMAHSKKGTRAPDPIEVPGPHTKVRQEEKRRKSTMQEFNRFIQESGGVVKVDG